MSIESRLEKLEVDDINRFVNDQHEENLSLEFKTITNGSLRLTDDKKNYAKALSGFANSSGGLVVWGVDARKNEDNIDCATQSKPIERINLFYSRLIELESEAVSPQVEGIKHRKFDLGNDTGYAVTYVPESVSGPHMAKLGEYRYYKRSGDTFYMMEHFDIADMFGRRKKPKLDLITYIIGQGNKSQINLGIKNSGRGSAKAPYLAFIKPKPFAISPYGVDGNRATGLPEIPSRGNNQWIQYGGNSQVIIHPNVILEVTSLYLGYFAQIPDPPKEGVTIRFKLTSEDSPMIEGEKHIKFDFA